MSEPREGWYLISKGDQWRTIIRHPSGDWTIPGAFEGDELPIGWTLGPSLDDLLRDAAAGHTQLNEIARLRRDAARLEWFCHQDIESEGLERVLRRPTWEFREAIDAEIARERGK